MLGREYFEISGCLGINFTMLIAHTLALNVLLHAHVKPGLQVSACALRSALCLQSQPHFSDPYKTM